jgi:hypothetical protein
MHIKSSLVFNLAREKSRTVPYVLFKIRRSDSHPIENQIHIIKTQLLENLFRSDVELDLDGLGLVLKVNNIYFAFVPIAIPKHLLFDYNYNRYFIIFS